MTDPNAAAAVIIGGAVLLGLLGAFLAPLKGLDPSHVGKVVGGWSLLGLLPGLLALGYYALRPGENVRTTPSAQPPAGRLAELDTLWRAGIITDAEYQDQRGRILRDV